MAAFCATCAVVHAHSASRTLSCRGALVSGAERESALGMRRHVRTHLVYICVSCGSAAAKAPTCRQVAAMKSRTSDRPKKRVTSLDPSKNNFSPTFQRSGDTRSWSMSLAVGKVGGKRKEGRTMGELDAVQGGPSVLARYVLGRVQLDVAVTSHGVLHQHLNVLHLHVHGSSSASLSMVSSLNSQPSLATDRRTVGGRLAAGGCWRCCFFFSCGRRCTRPHTLYCSPVFSDSATSGI